MAHHYLMMSSDANLFLMCAFIIYYRLFYSYGQSSTSVMVFGCFESPHRRDVKMSSSGTDTDHLIKQSTYLP